MEINYERLEEEIMGKVAFVTADTSNDVYFEMDGESGDSTSFYNWIRIWKGRKYSYKEMGKDPSVLMNYKIIVLSGDPAGINEALSISSFLKGKVLTMFLPEGDVCLYDQFGINSFSKEFYDLWNIVDIIYSMEEDKIGYYSNLCNAVVKFINVPIDGRMERGEFFVPRNGKSEHILVYGDNNSNGPITAVGVARKIKKPLRFVCIPEDKTREIMRIFGVDVQMRVDKQSQYPFLRILGRCMINVYPTRWVGSSREPVSCASVGTPCVGSIRSHTQRRLFPKLAFDPFDIEGMAEASKRLYEDKDFYSEVVEHAWKGIDFYGEGETKKRFLDAYHEAKERNKE